jgi:hypothetical protein
MGSVSGPGLLPAGPIPADASSRLSRGRRGSLLARLDASGDAGHRPVGEALPSMSPDLPAGQVRRGLLFGDPFGADDLLFMARAGTGPGAGIVASEAVRIDCVEPGEQVQWHDSHVRGLRPAEPCAPAGMLNVTYSDLIAERRQADASALVSDGGTS